MSVERGQPHLFQLLREMEDVDQLFVLHDDGVNPAFKTWRIFFAEREWRMPAVEVRRISQGVSAPAAAFRNAMTGVRVDPVSVGDSLRVIECRNPSEFVREWRASRVHAGQSQPRYYAADADSVERIVGRLDRDSQTGPVDLAELPVGVFLLAVHDCIDTWSSSTPRVRLSAMSLLDIAGSGFCPVEGAAEPRAMAALRRTLPFFKGCREGSQWCERATALERLVVAEVSPLGAKSATSDLERISVAGQNPLRTVPWADLSAEEARTVKETILATVALIRETASQEAASLDEHLQTIRTRLEQGMRGLPKEQASLVLAKFSGFADVPDTPIDVAGLVDVVRMLLGREADFDATGQAEDREGAIDELRALDAMAFKQLETDIHVANLAEGTFPGRVSSVGWPFRLVDLQWPGCQVDPISLEIMETRSAQAGQSDLYLLWLAVDSVAPGTGRVTLSWISELGNEVRSLSSLVTLLVEPPEVASEIVSVVGGLSVGPGDSTKAVLATPWKTPSPAPTSAEDKALQDAVALLDGRAAASAYACPRRFALQWAMGESSAFRAEHHHAMLYGNVMGALVKTRKASSAAARRVCDDLWRHLTKGERQSSLTKRVVKPQGGAPETWLLTLYGSGKRAAVGVNKAYIAARDGDPPDASALVPVRDAFLPRGVDNYQVCLACPVRDRCLEAHLDDD